MSTRTSCRECEYVVLKMCTLALFVKKDKNVRQHKR